MRHILSIAAMAMFVSTGAHAGLVKISFTGERSSSAPSVFGDGSVAKRISGYVVYDDATPGVLFSDFNGNMTYNYHGAVKEIAFDLGDGISGTASGDNLGYVQVFNGPDQPGRTDRLSFNNIFLLPDSLTGEPDGTIRFQVTIGLTGPGSVYPSHDLPGVLDPALFTGQKNLSLSVQRQPGTLPTGVAVSFNYNFDSLTIEPYGNAVPEPATLALLGAGMAGVAAARRRKHA